MNSFPLDAKFLSSYSPIVLLRMLHDKYILPAAKIKKMIEIFLFLLNLNPYVPKKIAVANLATLCKYPLKDELLKIMEMRSVDRMRILNHNGSLINAL